MTIIRPASRSFIGPGTFVRNLFGRRSIMLDTNRDNTDQGPDLPDYIANAPDIHTVNGSASKLENATRATVLALGGGAGGQGLAASGRATGRGGRNGEYKVWAGPADQVDGASITIGAGNPSVTTGSTLDGGDTSVILSGGINLVAEGGNGGQSAATFAWTWPNYAEALSDETDNLFGFGTLVPNARS